MNPLTPASFSPETVLKLQHAARHDRAIVIGRLAARLGRVVVSRLATLRPVPRPLSQTLAHWG